MAITLGARLAATGPAVTTVTVNGSTPDLALATAVIVRITSAINSPALTGINDTTSGRVVVIQNLSGNSLSVVFGSSDAKPECRLMTGSGTVTMATTATMTFRYDGTRQRWVLLAYSV